MFCPNCGSKNDDSLSFCTSCGANLSVHKNAYAQQTNSTPPPVYNGGSAYPPPQVPNASYPMYPQGYGNGQSNLPPVNYQMTLSVVACFFCLILGIIAITYSNKSKACYAAGDYNGATKNAGTARTLAIVGIAVGAFFLFCWLIAQ